MDLPCWVTVGACEESLVITWCWCILTEVNQLYVSLPLQAQVCLASVYSQEQVRDGSKSVQYLKMAAASGVSSLLDASGVLSTALWLWFHLPSWCTISVSLHEETVCPHHLLLIYFHSLFVKQLYSRFCNFLLRLSWSNTIINTTATKHFRVTALLNVQVLSHTSIVNVLIVAFQSSVHAILSI